MIYDKLKPIQWTGETRSLGNNYVTPSTTISEVPQ